MNTQSAQLAHRVAQIEHADHLARAAAGRRRPSKSATSATSTSSRPRRLRLAAIGALVTGGIVGLSTHTTGASPAIEPPPAVAWHRLAQCDYTPSTSLVVDRFLRAV